MNKKLFAVLLLGLSLLSSQPEGSSDVTPVALPQCSSGLLAENSCSNSNCVPPGCTRRADGCPGPCTPGGCSK